MTMLVNELMTDDPYTLGPDSDLSEVYELMESHHIRHVPIVDELQHLLGIVSHRDLAKSSLAESASELPVAERHEMMRQVGATEVMTRLPESVSPDDEVASAGEMMLEQKFGCLPVLDGDILVGILTEADFVRLVVEQQS